MGKVNAVVFMAFYSYSDIGESFIQLVVLFEGDIE